jgi:MFS family permease
MRGDWVPLSASALVIGVMSLVLGSVLNPAESGSTTHDMVRVVGEDSGQWLAVAVMYLIASFALILGLPCVLMLFDRRGRRLGIAGVSLLVVGAVGTCGYATLMMFFRALVAQDALRTELLTEAVTDPGLRIFLAAWLGSFYGGVLVIAVALLVARTLSRWVPVLLFVFVALLPLATALGRVGNAVQVMTLAVAFTGIAMAAVSDERRDALVRRSVL